MKKSLSVVIAVTIFLAALCLTLYPVISDYVNNQYQSEIQTAYAEEMAEMDDSTICQAWEAAQAYNESLLPVRYTEDALAGAQADYDDLLNLDGTGIMGYVEIPKINVYLPICHGTGAAALDNGVGHLVGSSLPIGGVGAHTVLTGHSGVAGKRLFSDLEQLETGDVFYLHVLGDVLAYQVDEINTVLPQDTTLLGSVDGLDCCTLITCTPFGVNTHRLLVRGVRIPYEDAKTVETETGQPTVTSTWKRQYYHGLILGVEILAGLAVPGGLILLFIKRRKRHDKD